MNILLPAEQENDANREASPRREVYQLGFKGRSATADSRTCTLDSVETGRMWRVLNLLPVSGLVAHACLDVREFLRVFVCATCVCADVTAGLNQSAACARLHGGREAGTVTNGSGIKWERKEGG